MKNETKHIMITSFCLTIMLMVGSLFSSCDGGDRSDITIPLTGEEENETNGEMDDPSQMEIYLWQEGNMPATTSYQTVANSSNPDGPDFRPNMVRVPVAKGVPVKGAVLLCAGGAFQFRGNSGDCFPVARELSALGYQCFVVNYRLRPYTQQEGALDLARAVRFVRFHADYYGINADNIVVAGFSAGGILCGEQVLNYRGAVNGSSLDNRYVPDALDNVSADVKGIGHIYSFYGRLSVASTDVELFRRSNLPPTFFCYGTEDPFANQFAACVNALRQADVNVEDLVLQGWPHGYGARGNWIPTFDKWITNVFTITESDIPTEGTLDMSQTVPSQILGGNQPYAIYLPPSYNIETNREYPILYLLHGLGQNYTSWVANGNMKAIADETIANGICEEMIIVSPEAYASFYVNRYYQEMNYEDYFINEFIPAIESTYRIKATKSGRSISGLSMGGYGCTYHAFSRPEMFSSCFAMSSAFTGTYPQIGDIIIERTEAELAKFPAFVMECGSDDFGAYPMNNNLNRILDQTTLEYTYTVRPGRHDWAFWQECLPKALKLASDNFK